jgi:hypothetical protein
MSVVGSLADMQYYVDGEWLLDPHSPTEKDHDGNENNVITIDDLQKLPIVGTETTPSALARQKQNEPEAPATEETPATAATTEELKAEAQGAVPEVADEADTNTSVTDQVKSKVLEVAAPVTAAAAAAGAAVASFLHTSTDGGELDRETSPIPGTFPGTPQAEEGDVIPEVAKTDDEPVPGAVVPSTTAEKEVPTETHNSDTLETGAAATAAGGFAAALAADKEANTAPTGTATSSAPAKNDTFGILPVPSATAPEGTKPLAQSTFQQDDKATFNEALAADKAANTAPVASSTEAYSTTAPKSGEFGILPVPSATAPEGTKPLAPSTFAPPEKTVGDPVHPDTHFQPVTSNANILSSSTAEDKTEILKQAAVNSSHHAADSAAQALASDAPSPAPLNAKAELAGLATGAGATAIGTATDFESENTGLSRLVVKKPYEEKVSVEADAKAAHVEPAIVLDDAKMAKPTVESFGTSGNAAVASTPVSVSVPAPDGVQEVHALGTAIVTDGGKDGAKLKEELLTAGKAPLPEGALAHLSDDKKEAGVVDSKVAPSTPTKATSTAASTPAKTPASVSSAARDKRASGVPSEAGSEKKKKKGGFFRKLKKVFS